MTGSPRIRNSIIYGCIIILAIVAVNLLGAGRYEFIGSVNNILTVIIASAATILCWYFWSMLDKGEPIEIAWRALGIGLGLWTVAEVIWTVLTLLGNEVPYPSVADVLWVAGYVFFFLVFLYLYRSVPPRPSTMTIIVSLIAATTYAAVIMVYIILPILQDPESTSLEKTLGVLYPIGDLALSLSACLLAFALLGGAFSWVWIFIASGFFSLSFSDIIFTYADWNGLYFPGGAMNMVSMTVDMTYISGYLLVAMGIISQIQYTLRDLEEPLIERYRSLLDDEDETYFTVTIQFFTNAENRIISASPVAGHLLHSDRRATDLDGMLFHDAAGIDVEFSRRLFQDLLENGPVTNRSTTVLLKDRKSTRAYISGVSSFNIANRYIGSDITLTMRLRPDQLPAGTEPEIFAPGRPEEASDANIVTDRLISTFFIGKVHTLYAIVYRFGGINASKSMQRIFNTSARRLNAAVHMEGSRVEFGSQIDDLPRYRELLKGVINYAVAIASLEVVRRQIDTSEKKLDPTVLQAGEDAGLTGLNPDLPAPGLL